MSQKRQICTFYLGEYCYGIDVSLVQEVISDQVLTRIPLAPPAVVGLMNIRGQIITAISARKAMRMEVNLDLTESTILVVGQSEVEVGLLADDIGDIIEIQTDQVEQAPETLGKRVRSFIEGIVSWQDELVMILDLEHLLNDELCLKAKMAENNNLMQTA